MRVAPFVVIVFIENPRWILANRWGPEAVAGRIRLLPKMLTLHPKAGLVATSLGLEKVNILYQGAEVRSHMVAGVPNSAIYAAIHE